MLRCSTVFYGEKYKVRKMILFNQKLVNRQLKAFVAVSQIRGSE